MKDNRIIETNVRYKSVRKISAMIAITLFSLNASASQPDPMVKEARMAIKSFATELKGELQSAMKAGGPVNAIAVCNKRAPEITAKVNAGGKLRISRVSLKNRNPDNAPDEWQKKILGDFEARLAAGEMPGKIDYAETVDTPGGREFRYMKAIPTGEICLNCHGANLRDDVRAKLDELYPADKARGFSKGDIRGAFYVTIPQ